MILQKSFLLLLLSFQTLCSGFSLQDPEGFMSKLNILENELTSLQSNLDGDQYEEDDETKRDNSYMPEDETLSNMVKRQSSSPKTFKCGFNTDCVKAFTFDLQSPLQWKIQKSSRHNSVKDRLDPAGHILQAAVSSTNNRKQYATLSIPFTVQTQDQCGEFYYYMYNREGCDVARFLVTLVCDDKNETVEVFRSSASHGQEWHRVFMPVKKPVGTNCRTTWRVSQGLVNTGNVYLDDVAMYYQACPKPDGPDFPSQASCYFTKDNCQWTTSGDMGWSRGLYSTPTFNTGPDRCYRYHDCNNGYYLYMESSKPNNPNKTAILTSQRIGSTKPHCMRFMYNMYGRDIGSLEVASISSSDGSQKVLFKKEGPQEKRWLEGWVTLQAEEEYKVQIKGTSGNGPRSDIAIDDVTITEGACPPSQPSFSSCHYKGENDCSYTNEVCKQNNDTDDGFGSFKYPSNFKAQKNKLLGTVPAIAKEWELSFEVKPIGVSDSWTSFLHLSSKSSTRGCCSAGDRIPGIYFIGKSRRLHICYAIGHNGNWCYNSPDLPQNQYTKIEINQKKEGTKYRYSIEINGETKYSTFNYSPRDFAGVKVYGTHPHNAASNAEVKNIVLNNLVEPDHCTGLCSADHKAEIVDGKEVQTVTYDMSRCSSYYWNEIDVPKTTVNTRLSCLTFKYRINAPSTRSRCHIEVHSRKNTERYHRRVFHRIYDGFEDGTWVTVKRDFAYPIYSGLHYKIGIYNRLSSSCSSISYADLELQDGVCSETM